METPELLQYSRIDNVAVALLSSGIWRARRSDGLEWLVTSVRCTCSIDFPEEKFKSMDEVRAHLNKFKLIRW